MMCVCVCVAQLTVKSPQPDGIAIASMFGSEEV